MTAPTSHLDAAAKLGVPVTEISDVADSPAGLVVVTTDANTYVIVPADKPDADGKTGLMYLTAPGENYTGSFPVYTLPSDDEPAPAKQAAAVITDAAKSADAANRAELVARAKELGITLNGRMKTETIAGLIADAEQAQQAGADDSDDADSDGEGDGESAGDGDEDGDE